MNLPTTGLLELLPISCPLGVGLSLYEVCGKIVCMCIARCTRYWKELLLQLLAFTSDALISLHSDLSEWRDPGWRNLHV